MAANKDDLNQHVNALHNKMYKCEKCEFKGTSKRYLNDHFYEKHNNSKKQASFACDECKYESILERNLIEHQTNKHGWIQSKRKQRDYSKPNADRISRLCVFWNHGFCRNEFNCKFLHEEIPACYYQENCRIAKCSYYHYNKAQNTFLGRRMEKHSIRKH